MSRWYLVQIHSNNPNNHNHLKHCIAKLQLRVELIHSVVQRQQWQAKSVMEWSLILSGMDSYKCIQMQNILFIIYKTIYGYLGIPDSINWSSNNDLLLYRSPPPPPPPPREEVGGQNQEWQQDGQVKRCTHTQSVTKISLYESANTFSPTPSSCDWLEYNTPGHTQDVGQGVVNGPNKHSKRSHLSWQV